jgi:acylphosphatase
LANSPAARRYIVSGRVQGVGFRAFAERHASRLALAGWVRNLAGGGVEIHAQGSSQALSEFEGYLRSGPAWSEVRSLDIHEAAPVALASFVIRR